MCFPVLRRSFVCPDESSPEPHSAAKLCIGICTFTYVRYDMYAHIRIGSQVTSCTSAPRERTEKILQLIWQSFSFAYTSIYSLLGYRMGFG